MAYMDTADKTLLKIILKTPRPHTLNSIRKAFEKKTKTKVSWEMIDNHIRKLVDAGKITPIKIDLPPPRNMRAKSATTASVANTFHCFL